MNKISNRNTPEYKAKRNEYMRKYYKESYAEKQLRLNQARKEKIRVWYRDLRSQQVCSRCPETDSCCIDFHHLRDKEIELNAAVDQGYSKKRILAEIAKCVALCSNCHRKLHAGRFEL